LQVLAAMLAHAIALNRGAPRTAAPLLCRIAIAMHADRS